MDKKKLKQITDKDLIVFLVATGHELISIGRDMVHNRSLVYFEDSKALDKAILDFTNKAIDINIADYQAAEKRVKTLLCMQKVS